MLLDSIPRLDTAEIRSRAPYPILGLSKINNHSRGRASRDLLRACTLVCYSYHRNSMSQPKTLTLSSFLALFNPASLYLIGYAWLLGMCTS